MVIKIKKIVNKQIIVSYEYYVPETYSFVDEKMFETNISEAIILLIKGTNIAIDDFAFDVDTKNKRYNIYLEPNLYPKNKINIESIDSALLNSLMDSALQLTNTRYAILRMEGKINPCSIYLLESQTQLLCYDKMKYIAHKNGDSFKPIHYLINDEYRNLFLPFAKKN